MIHALVAHPHARSALLFALSVLALTVVGCTSPVRVEWSTETELNTAGFNLYRSESSTGPFDLKVNEQLIAAALDPLLGGDYSFVDRSARTGAAYYYLLEEVELTGAKITHGPISVNQTQAGWAQRAFVGALALLVVALWLWGARRHSLRSDAVPRADSALAPEPADAKDLELPKH